MIRVAATADIHLGESDGGTLRPALADLGEHADLLLVAGDLTQYGTLAEARVAVDELAGLEVPVVAVLGNHDHHSDLALRFTDVLGDAGVRVLEGAGLSLEIGGLRCGIAGVKGFGGGFVGKNASAFGEQVMKEFVGHSVAAADELRAALGALDTDVRIALTHYAPIPETLLGEPPEIHPFLGSYLLGEAIDEPGADLAVHGHAHHGREHGCTPGGVRVRNVALPVIDTAYTTYTLHGPDEHVG